MNYGYLKRLYARRAELEAKLELHEARYCFGEEEVDDGTDSDLRQRLSEVSEEIAALENRTARAFPG
ncbi:hypothetical protein [Rhizobium bangladeshense]|uniref:hypothetical protein n=1 Tax=Rhizobium bangladeshense TaxID=1138189 RepID=UPI001A990AE5|nr:hypothetical protein [Rhizobium bangladeshense]MBX4934900.1 hypothetical protein [Rhizobium bangladeshense]MBY3580358.1 hypothetical protein [Rhizobium bangladeshense]QSY91410.1 hypothetical protein J2J98_25290 [Rhizobium bangladeshense]